MKVIIRPRGEQKYEKSIVFRVVEKKAIRLLTGTIGVLFRGSIYYRATKPVGRLHSWKKMNGRSLLDDWDWPM